MQPQEAASASAPFHDAETEGPGGASHLADISKAGRVRPGSLSFIAGIRGLAPPQRRPVCAGAQPGRQVRVGAGGSELVHDAARGQN